jgi:CENP-B N-terminal DNA-binding domain
MFSFILKSCRTIKNYFSMFLIEDSTNSCDALQSPFAILALFLPAKAELLRDTFLKSIKGSVSFTFLQLKRIKFKMSQNSVFDEEEIQLDDGSPGPGPSKRTKYNSHTTEMKLEAIEWARKVSVKSAAKRFGVGRGSITQWAKQEKDIKQQM